MSADPRVKRADQIREAVLVALRFETGPDNPATKGLHHVCVAAWVVHARVQKQSIGVVSRAQVQRALAKLREQRLAVAEIDGWRAVQ